MPIILVVRSQSGANSVARPHLAGAARNPASFNFAAGGVGASSHLAGELFRSMARIQWQIVGNKGGAPTLVDLLGGQVDLTFSPIASSIQHVKAGRPECARRHEFEKSASAAGFADDRRIRGAWLCGQRVVWRGGARARPRDIIQKLNREINALLKNPEFREGMLARGAVPMGGSREEFAAFMRQEVGKYAALVKESGIKLE